MPLPTQDIVEWLRSMPTCFCAGDGTENPNLYNQAAATISRLTADNEALRAAHHKTSHKAVKRLRALWREKQAAESRADALTQEVAEAKRLLANSLKEFAPISAASHRKEVQDFLDCAALGERE